MATKSLTFELFGKDKSASKVIKGVGDETSKAGEKLKNFKKLAVVGAAAAGVGFVLAKGFERLKNIDNATAKLTGLGHSAETVQRIMDNALASVKGTAFGLDEAATVAASAVAAGVKPGEDLERTLRLVADAATIAGTDMGAMGAIFGKAAASNKVQLGIISQLHTAGIPALQFLAKEMGVTADEASSMASRGEIDFATFQRAMEEGLGGAALASGQTFEGAMDNVMASIARIGENLLLGLFPDMKDGLIDLQDALAPVEEDALKVGEAVGEIVQAFVDLERDTQFLSDFIDDLAGFGDFVDDVERYVTALSNLGNPEERYNWAEDQKVRGGMLGEFLTWADDMGQGWSDMWGGVREGTEEGISGAHSGMGGGLALMGGDLSVFRQAVGEEFAGTWTDSDGATRTGMSNIDATLVNKGLQVASTISKTVGGMLSTYSTGWVKIEGVFSGAGSRISNIATGVGRTFAGVAKTIRDAFDGIGKFIADAFGPIGDFLGGTGNAIRNFFGGTGDAARNMKGRLSAAAYQSPGAGGSALARVRATLPGGLAITDTLSSPARDAMFGLQRSAGSYHYDASNPAVDIAGPIPLLHQYARQLMAMGGWRQFLWQTAGHYDHIHVAHGGGMVSSSWPRMPGDRADERTARLQVGEKVVPRGGAASDMADIVVPVYLDGEKIATAIRKHDRRLR